MLVDHFSTRSERLVSFTEGLYQFEIHGDTGVRFKVDGRTIFEEGSAWEVCNPCRLRVDMAEGQHTLVVEQWDTVLSAHVSLKWAQVSPRWESLSNPYEVDAMAVDDEHVWTGGNGGLVRWDKRTLTPKLYHSEDGLPENTLHALLVDRSRALWVGTGTGYLQGGSGLGRYDGSKWQTFTTADGLCSSAIFDLFQDQDSSLWIGTDWGLNRYNPASGEWRCYHVEDGLGSNYPIAVHRDTRGRLWVSAGGTGVSVLLPDGAWRTYTFDEIGKTDIWGLEPVAEDAQGNLWFGSWRGAVRFDGQRWQVFTKKDGLPSDEVLALARDQMGNMWFGTSNGAARYDGTTWQVFTTTHGLACNCIMGLVVDQDGILWAGHAGEHGISRFDGKHWLSSPAPEGTLIPNHITSIMQDWTGKLWFGTGFPPTQSGDGMRTFDGVRWETFGGSDCLSKDFIDGMVQDKSGNFWFGYDGAGGGVTRFDGKSCKTFTKADGLAGDQVDGILQDRDGNLWFGTSDGGLSRYDGKSWHTFNTDNAGLPSNDINALYQDSAGNLWVGTPRGVARYDGKGWAVFTTMAGLAHDEVVGIVGDANGMLWIGTNGGGISVGSCLDLVHGYQG